MKHLMGFITDIKEEFMRLLKLDESITKMSVQEIIKA